MRHAVKVLIIGGVLLSAGACGTANNPAPGSGVGIGSATAPPAAERSAEASTKTACEALGQVYSKHMAPYAQALGQLVEKDGATAERQTAQKSLISFASAIRGATKDNPDPKVVSDGEKTAKTLQAKAKDAGTFTAIKTNADVNTAMGTTLKEWLAPVEQHCS
jgi:hypothetical protein